VHKVHRAIEELRVQLGQKALKGQPVHRELKELKELRGQPEQLVHRDLKEP
jgi:hypothetical protein